MEVWSDGSNNICPTERPHMAIGAELRSADKSLPDSSIMAPLLIHPALGRDQNHPSQLAGQHPVYGCKR